MPKTYSLEERNQILQDIFKDISSGDSIRKAAGKSKINIDTFYDWIGKDKSISEQYARACEARADLIFEDILNIADDNGQDTRFTEDGAEVTNHDVIQRSRLRVDARKWMLSKMQPKKYGDKLDLTTDGESMNLSPEEKLKRLSALKEKLKNA